MRALDCDGLVHGFSHVNEERRAGRTFCGQYLEFWARDLLADDTVVTCLTCVAEPGFITDSFDNPSAVDERWQDVVKQCGHHLYHQDADGRCSRCGYGQSVPT